jgi:hypothetical protein
MDPAVPRSTEPNGVQLQSSRPAHKNDVKTGLALEGDPGGVLHEGGLASVQDVAVDHSTARDGVADRDAIVAHLPERRARRTEFDCLPGKTRHRGECRTGPYKGPDHCAVRLDSGRYRITGLEPG